MSGTVQLPVSVPTRIRKRRRAEAPVPNVRDYKAARREFSWDRARAALDGLPGGRGLNTAHGAVDRRAAGPLAGKVAVRWLGRRGERPELTYADLAAATSRFANVLASLGIAR
jgi:acetyl-CoA synthetase